VVTPILLYHHIGTSPTNSQYYITPEEFEKQMQLLRSWGYTSITTSTLINAIHHGADLPPRPIIITFDDGNLDNYTTAFPIMQQYQLVGVLYLVGNYLNAKNFMNIEQAKEMLEAGWEIGSHTMNHYDLLKLTEDQKRIEIAGSRSFLEDEFGLPILTIAYPFGEYDCGIMNAAYSAGYLAGMGLGASSDQHRYDLFALHRFAIKATYDLQRFSQFLPWQGELTIPH